MPVPKQKLIEATSYNTFVAKLKEKLEAGYVLVPGMMHQWKVDGEEEFPGVLMKYVAVLTTQ